MNDFIDRQAAIDAMSNVTVLDKSAARRILTQLPTIEAVPNDAYQRVVWENAVMAEQLNKIGKCFGADMDDVVPVRKGRWIEQEDYNLDTYYDCSVCGESWCTVDGTPWENGMNYCPHCGAKMEGEQDDND